MNEITIEIDETTDIEKVYNDIDKMAIEKKDTVIATIKIKRSD